MGRDGTIWLDLRYGSEREGPRSYVGRVDGDGVFTELSQSAAKGLGFPIPSDDGAVWFVLNRGVGQGETAGSFVRIAPTGERRAYHLGPRFGLLEPAAAGSGFVWFEYDSPGPHARPRIGRISVPAPHGVETEYRLGPRCRTGAMVAKGRALYFDEDCERRSPSGETALRSRIVRIGPTGAVQRFPLPVKERISALAVGPEGTVWFASPGYSYSLVGWIDQAGKVTEYRVHHAMTTSIAVGRDGRLWFPASFGGQSYRALNSISRRGDIGKPFCIDPECVLVPEHLTTAPDGSLWYSTWGATSVGGGGGAHQIEGLAIENQPGAVGHLPL